MKTARADRGSMVSSLRARADRSRTHESGQALVEFAVIIPLFLMIVVGIIQFGVGLNWWLDLQRVANQGARWAAVNCGQSAATPGSDPCVSADGSTDIEEALHDMVISGANDSDVEVCWVNPSGPGGTAKSGDAVRVKLTTQFGFLSIVGFLDDTEGLAMDLRADATMRLEQTPTSAALAGVTACP
jgi:TadE-like protein